MMNGCWMKRSVAFLTVLILCCLMIGTVEPAFAEKDPYYPGPAPGGGGKPVPVVTPKPTSKPKPNPTPKPTAKPAPATPKPQPFKVATPTPEPEEPVEEHTLTVYYEYPDGTPAASTYEETFEKGTEFTVQSPEIPGYNMSHAVVHGRMGHRDMAIVVYYYKGTGYIDIEDYETPLGLGDTIINIGDCYE